MLTSKQKMQIFFHKKKLILTILQYICHFAIIVTNLGGYVFEGNPQITKVICRALTPPASKRVISIVKKSTLFSKIPNMATQNFMFPKSQSMTIVRLSAGTTLLKSILFQNIRVLVA